MMGRVGERLRASWSTLLRGELEGVRAELTTSWTASFDELRRDIVTERDAVAGRVAEHDMELVNAMHRVAEAFESIAESLDSDRRDRREQLDAVEFLLREMVLGFAHPTAVSPTIFGGTVRPAPCADTAAVGSNGNGNVDIDLSDFPIPVGTLVEVRSRFHDQWVHGFAIAEYIPGPTRRGYRLRRHTDTDPLPLLFDAADVQRATVPVEHPAVETSEEPEPSMWR